MIIPFPTRLGNTLILLSFMLYLASMSSGSGLLLLVLGILFAMYLLNIAGAIRGCSSIRFAPPVSVTCTEGEKLTEVWEVQNRSNFDAGLVKVDAPFGPILKVGIIPGGKSAHVTPNLLLPRRGVYQYRKLKAACSFPFGLVECRRSLPIAGEIVVYPSTYQCDPPAAGGFEPMVGGKFTGGNRSSSGDSFHGVRPYQTGDPVKMIHWRSSAKGLGMMTKEFDEELSGRVGIITDCTPTGTDRSKALDAASRAAASLVFAALDAGHQVAFCRLGDDQLIHTPPFADAAPVMEALARMSPDPAAQSRENLEHAVQLIPKKSSICLVLTEVGSETARFIRRLAADRLGRVAVYIPAGSYAEDLGVAVCTYNAHSMGGRVA